MYIFASDFDGTLNRGGISEKDRAAVEHFRRAGNLFGIVTGRHWDMFGTVRREKLGIDFIIAMNGSMLISASGDVQWCEWQKNNGVVEWIASYLGREYNTFLTCVFGRESLTFHDGRPKEGERFAPIEKAAQIREFTQMNTHCPSRGDASRAVREIKAVWGGVVNPLQNGEWIDMPPAGVDKGVGIARYAKRMGVPEAQIFTAGDDCNDLPMIARFHGLAVENAAADVKAAAERTLPGVAEMIDYILSLAASEPS